MNTLLAYIPGDGYYKVLTHPDEIYDSAGLVFDHNCPFTEGADLDDDEWFKLEDFDQKPYFPQILAQNNAAAAFNQLLEQKYNDLGFLMAIQDQGNTYCFQKLTSQSILKRKLLSISQMPVILQLTKTILLEPIPHAVYKRNENALYFKRLGIITSIFPGIVTLYEEATKEERDAFMSEPFMEATGQIAADKISSANLKRIHSASKKLQSLTPKQKTKILDYIHKYNKSIPYDNARKKFTIAGNKELQFFLWGIEERYFSTITKKEKRVARSILIIKK